MGSGWFQAGKNEPYILLERLDVKVVKLPILHSVRSSPSLFRDKQFLAVSRPKAPPRGDTTSIELVFSTSFMWWLRLRERHRFSTTSSVLPFISDCYLQNAWVGSRSSDGNVSYTSLSSPLISSVLRHYGVFDGTHCSADVSGCFSRSCPLFSASQKLSNVVLFERCFLDIEQFSDPPLLAVSRHFQRCRVNNICVH